MKRTTFIFLIVFGFAAAFYVFPDSGKPAVAGMVQVCVDFNTCNPDASYTCYLRAVLQPGPFPSCVTGDSGCCALECKDPGWYYWEVTDGINTYYSETFYFDGTWANVKVKCQ
jgi:hypothetical protein